MPRIFFFLKQTPKVLMRPAVGGSAWFLLPVVLQVASWRGSGGGWAVHSGQEVKDLGPLGWADMLAHVHNAVPGHFRVVLHQAAVGGERGLGSFLPLSSVGPRAGPKNPCVGPVSCCRVRDNPELPNLFVLWSPWG